MAYKKLKLWFDKELAKMLSEKIVKVNSSFKSQRFIKNVDSKVIDLELKDRVEVIADELYYEFGENYIKGVKILLKILGPENKKETGMFTEFYWVMPIAKFVEKYGLDEFETSMMALEEITKRNTSEYAIRPFIEKYTAKTIEQMITWSGNENKHIRRLSSEGVRPRLPWAKKLDVFIKNPEPIIPILENLKNDSSKYVQKSVANCINDILKDNLDFGRKLIESWNKKPITKERQWIIKHSLRNLLKVDNEWAINMIS